jgi:hypothetical protein
MSEQATDTIVRNLIESLERLRADLDRMELWTAVLDRFQHPVPDFQPGDQHLLPQRPRRKLRRSQASPRS